MSEELKDQIKAEDSIVRDEALHQDVSTQLSALEDAGDSEQVERSRKENRKSHEAIASTLGASNVGDADRSDPSTGSNVDSEEDDYTGGLPANVHQAGALYEVAAAQYFKVDFKMLRTI